MSLKEEIDKFYSVDKLKSYTKYSCEQIIKEWGYSSVKLKEYLNDNYFEDKNYANEFGDIKINYILPYKNTINGKFNGFYGQMAIDRLTLAIEAKALIMNSIEYNALEENKLGKNYVCECFRLYLRIQSFNNRFEPLLTFEEFDNIMKNAYNLADKHFDEQYTKLSNICKTLKPKKDQVLYHYTREDFEPIRYFDKMKEAYNYWIENIWPHLLDNYKQKKLNEFLHVETNKYLEQNRKMSFEEAEKLRKKYMIKLDKIKINKIKYIQFTKIIKKLRNGEL